MHGVLTMVAFWTCRNAWFQHLPFAKRGDENAPSGPRRLRPWFLVLALGLAACSEDKSAPQQAAPLPPIPVGVIKITERPTHPQLSFVGRVEATDSVDLIARVDGFLDKRTFTEGQAVKTGDLLFVLQKDALQAAQANLAKAQADADNLKLQTERARSLYKQKTVSQAMLDDRVAAEKQALAVVQQAQASLERAQINLGYTDIRAPFSGRIGMANFSVGALVGPSSGPLATIVSQDPIYVTFPVSDKTILDLTEGGRTATDRSNVAVSLKLSNGMTYPQTGAIDFTGIKINPNTDTLMVRAQFPNPNNVLIDGQYVQVTAASKHPVEALLVPQKAIMTDQSGNYVLAVGEDNKVIQRQITQGSTFGSNVVVKSGLAVGDQVVVDGLQRIRPGQKVDPQIVDATTPAQKAMSVGN
ncbi:RND family efflux transporter MFP subunit [Brucella melitensis M5-90]|nr:RND family efflux transporter MFP subunit [Brucella melitensis M5-90]AEQ10027.1 efflux transporter, RND family, MFP subunit [Brucella melitensis NI]